MEVLTSIEKYKAEIKDLRKELESYKTQNEVMASNIRLLRKALYGQSSERVEDLPDQYKFFDEAELESCKVPPKQIEVTYKRQKGKKKRAPFPDDLEREVVVTDLPEKDKVCPEHGTPLKEIKSDVKEYLVTRPPEVKVREVQTKRYTCPCCDKPPIKHKKSTIIPGSIATEETIAFIIFSKYFQHLPLYRLEDLYKLYDIKLSRSVMASWMVNIASRLTPLYNVLEEMMLSTGYIGVDATRVQVLKEDGRKAKSKSSMWVRGSQELGIALFDYDISEGQAAVRRILSGYKGTVQADEHSCYNVLDKGALRLGCGMHARRKFKKAQDVSKVRSPLAEEGLSFFRKIYDLEKSYKGLSVEERYEARLKEHEPLLREYEKWLLKNKEKVPPSSKIGEAINYSLKHWEHLTGYLKNGRYEVDNGFVERCIKQFALGRKNWLFSDTAKGAEASSILYSILVTIKLNGKDPYETLVEILRRLPETDTPEKWEALAQLLLSE